MFRSTIRSCKNRLLRDAAAHDSAEPATRAWWDRAYREGPVRWDTGLTPPEVQAFWRSGLVEKSGVALDLGCGTGANTIYLASLGLSAIGIELSSVALVRAHERVGCSPVDASSAWLIQADVSSLPISNLNACYILDVGCFHALPQERRSEYAANVIDNLAPGGFYHLYAHDASADGLAGHERRGVAEAEVAQRFRPRLSLVSIQRGRPDPTPARWYLFYKPT